MKKEWYVIQTNPREEGIAAAVIREKGMDVYQPFMEKYIFHARKKQLKKYPLFPNYLFVNMAPVQEELHKVRWARGVRRILLDTYSPVPVNEDFVNGLYSIEAMNEGIIKKPVNFTPGETIRVTSGPMKDVYGIFDCWESDDCRVKILIEMVSSQARVAIHSSMIEKA